ncbi:hypothetical protein [Corynebacterium cystitidis]|uniref:hypothetical protein n=1 Tax=Corynebacterium cystitidis TaxID=35757 RepID=UPI00211F4489|nr:hypothetical protein [Corynebacterium cystitidis]
MDSYEGLLATLLFLAFYMTMTATFFVLRGVTVAEHGSGLGQPNRAWLRGWLD